MLKKYKFLLASIIILVAAGSVLLILYINNRGYYTVVKNGTDGARCLAIGPECETQEIVLKTPEGNTRKYTYYRPDIVNESGETKTPSDLKEGTKVKIDSKLDTSISKFIIKD